MILLTTFIFETSAGETREQEARDSIRLGCITGHLAASTELR